jgi:DNA-binding response OmpR family regulator
MSKILVVDDEVDITKVLKKRLSTAGFDVIIAMDGYQGTEFAYKELPDLIILDLMLPAGGGLSVLKNLKLSVKTSDIPVVVLTAMRDEKYKNEILTAGVESYLEKPYDIEKLIVVIKDLLDKKKEG